MRLLISPIFLLSAVYSARASSETLWLDMFANGMRLGAVKFTCDGACWKGSITADRIFLFAIMPSNEGTGEKRACITSGDAFLGSGHCLVFNDGKVSPISVRYNRSGDRIKGEKRAARTYMRKRFRYGRRCLRCFKASRMKGFPTRWCLCLVQQNDMRHCKDMCPRHQQNDLHDHRA